MVKTRLLGNGIPVIMEKSDGFRSAVVGIWVKVGSRNELPEDRGVSHFIEHMLFKGTARRSAEQIAVEVDSIGGDLNAYTSRETTTFYIKVLDEYLDNGIDLLSDITVHSVLDPAEIEKEKGIVEEEIRMVEDTPDEYVFDLFSMNVWGESGLGQPILGTASSVGGFTREEILGYMGEHYGPANIVIACAGNFEEERIMDLLDRTFTMKERPGGNPGLIRPQFRPNLRIHQKDLSEVHMCLGFEGLPVNSPDRYTLLMVNTILGSGISSRLFQEVREKRGLVYSIHSFVSSFYDTGSIGIYAGASRKNYREVTDIVKKQTFSLKDTITADELERTKGQLKGNILLSLESTSARMSNIAKQKIYQDSYLTPDEIIRRIEKVTLDDARGLSARLFNPEKTALTLLGPVES